MRRVHRRSDLLRVRRPARFYPRRCTVARWETNHRAAGHRIVPHLQLGAGVVTTRGDVHYVVTEFGVAPLYGKTLRQRARALIDIAHPQFRASLERAATERNLL